MGYKTQNTSPYRTPQVSYRPLQHLGASLMLNPTNLSQYLGKSIEHAPGYEQLVNNCLEQSQYANLEVEQLRLNLEKTRKEYKRLLAQLDEDQDEVITLRTKNRKLVSDNVLQK